jgi:integrase
VSPLASQHAPYRHRDVYGHTSDDAARAPIDDLDQGRVTAHALWHTAASLAISAGANPKVVQRMLGHASAAMTLDVYAELFESDLDTVADRLETALAAPLPLRRY